MGQWKIRISEDTDLCRFLFPLLCPLQRQRQRLAKHDAAKAGQVQLAESPLRQIPTAESS